MKSSGGVRYSHSKPSADFKEFRAYSREWEKTYFDHETGGYVVTHKDRIKSGKQSDNEWEKFMKEQDMAQDLAQQGHKVAHLSDLGRPKGQTYDILYDGKPADLKSVSSHNNIERYARHALRDQGAKIVIFRLETSVKQDKALIALRGAKRKYKGRIVYYSQKDGKIHEI
ncbi:MAG: hypothetical protein LUD17_05195 [Bacteroidales bacterium]|nr:hypothetical protein [Bacteroidales bacterium]